MHGVQVLFATRPCGKQEGMRGPSPPATFQILLQRSGMPEEESYYVVRGVEWAAGWLQFVVLCGGVLQLSGSAFGVVLEGCTAVGAGVLQLQHLAAATGMQRWGAGGAQPRQLEGCSREGRRAAVTGEARSWAGRPGQQAEYWLGVGWLSHGLPHS